MALTKKISLLCVSLLSIGTLIDTNSSVAADWNNYRDNNLYNNDANFSYNNNVSNGRMLELFTNLKLEQKQNNISYRSAKSVFKQYCNNIAKQISMDIDQYNIEEYNVNKIKNAIMTNFFKHIVGINNNNDVISSIKSVMLLSAKGNKSDLNNENGNYMPSYTNVSSVDTHLYNYLLRPSKISYLDICNYFKNVILNSNMEYFSSVSDCIYTGLISKLNLEDKYKLLTTVLSDLKSHITKYNNVNKKFLKNFINYMGLLILSDINQTKKELKNNKELLDRYIISMMLIFSKQGIYSYLQNLYDSDMLGSKCQKAISESIWRYISSSFETNLRETKLNAANIFFDGICVYCTKNINTTNNTNNENAISKLQQLLFFKRNNDDYDVIKICKIAASIYIGVSGKNNVNFIDLMSSNELEEKNWWKLYKYINKNVAFEKIMTNPELLGLDKNKYELQLREMIGEYNNVIRNLNISTKNSNVWEFVFLPKTQHDKFEKFAQKIGFGRREKISYSANKPITGFENDSNLNWLSYYITPENCDVRINLTSWNSFVYNINKGNHYNNNGKSSILNIIVQEIDNELKNQSGTIDQINRDWYHLNINNMINIIKNIFVKSYNCNNCVKSDKFNDIIPSLIDTINISKNATINCFLDIIKVYDYFSNDRNNALNMQNIYNKWFLLNLTVIKTVMENDIQVYAQKGILQNLHDIVAQDIAKKIKQDEDIKNNVKKFDYLTIASHIMRRFQNKIEKFISKMQKLCINNNNNGGIGNEISKCLKDIISNEYLCYCSPNFLVIILQDALIDYIRKDLKIKNNVINNKSIKNFVKDIVNIRLKQMKLFSLLEMCELDNNELHNMPNIKMKHMPNDGYFYFDSIDEINLNYLKRMTKNPFTNFIDNDKIIIQGSLENIFLNDDLLSKIHKMKIGNIRQFNFNNYDNENNEVINLYNSTKSLGQVYDSMINILEKHNLINEELCQEMTNRKENFLSIINNADTKYISFLIRKYGIIALYFVVQNILEKDKYNYGLQNILPNELYVCAIKSEIFDSIKDVKYNGNYKAYIQSIITMLENAFIGMEDINNNSFAISQKSAFIKYRDIPRNNNRLLLQKLMHNSNDRDDFSFYLKDNNINESIISMSESNEDSDNEVYSSEDSDSKENNEEDNNEKMMEEKENNEEDNNEKMMEENEKNNKKNDNKKMMEENKKNDEKNNEENNEEMIDKED